MNIQKVRQYLTVIKKAATFIEAELDNDGGLLEELVKEKTELKVATVVVPDSKPEPSEEWKKLRDKHIQDLISIDVWPECIPNYNITHESDVVAQINRANCVLDMILDRTVSGFEFLDYGCGDGWITKEVLGRGVHTSTGFDICQSSNWDKFSDVQNLKFVTDSKELPSNSYDAIMLYDVLDHCEDPVSLMADVHRLLKWDGVLYARCHPWTSKHANHIFKSGINKAYIHLFLTWDEMKGLIGKDPMFTRPEKDPLEAYRWWFHNFDIKKERFIKEPVHEFFLNPSFKSLLATENQLNEKQLDEMLELMQLQFIDYIMSPKTQ